MVASSPAFACLPSTLALASDVTLTYSPSAPSAHAMGFHAPQEAAKVLGEALDYARQGETVVARLGFGVTKVAAVAAPAAPAPAPAKKP